MEVTWISGAEPDDGNLAALSLELNDGEQPKVACSVQQMTTTEGEILELQRATVVVTNRRVLVSKDKLFGKPKLNWQMDLDQISSVGHGLHYGTGPACEAHFKSIQGNLGIFVFGQMDQAETFRNALQSASVNPGETVPSESEPSSEDIRLFSMLHGFLQEVEVLAGPDYLGKPFGDGTDLGRATGILNSYFSDIDSIRSATRMMVTDIAVAGYDGVEADMSAVMGANQQTLSASGLDSLTQENVVGLAGMSYNLIPEIESSGHTLDVWNGSDLLATEMFCFYCVARLRMANKGLMPPVERPDWL